MSTEEALSQELCRSCGLCCDGTLFSRAPVGADERVHPTLAAGGSWTERDGTRFFALACCAFSGTCTIYDQERPRVCGRFKCALLRNCETGAVGWNDAAAIIATAKTRSAAVRRAMNSALGVGAAPGSSRTSLSQLRKQLQTSRDAAESQIAFRARHGRIFAEHAALREYLRRHFRPGPRRHATHHYRVHGFSLDSEIELPDLPAAPADPRAVVIRYGTVPDALAAPVVRVGRRQVAPGEYLSDIEGVARYWVRGGSRVVVARTADAADEDVRVFLMSSVLGALCHQKGLLPLHASAVVIDGEAVLFLGASGAGKSTLAAACRARGHSVLTDDLAAISLAVDRRPVVHTGSGTVKLRSDVIELLGLRDEARHLRSQTGKHAVRLAAPPRAALPIRAIFALDAMETGRDAIEIDAVPAADGVRLLAKGTYRRRLVRPLGQRAGHFALAAALGRQTPMFRLRRPPGLSRLDEIIAALDRMAWGSPVSSPDTR